MVEAAGKRARVCESSKVKANPAAQATQTIGYSRVFSRVCPQSKSFNFRSIAALRDVV